MDTIIKSFGTIVICMLSMYLIMQAVFQTDDGAGHKGIMEISGNGMSAWQDDGETGYAAYKEASGKAFPELEVKAKEALAVGTYRLDDLFSVSDYKGNDGELALLTAVFPNGEEHKGTYEAAEITFPVKGIYTLKIEIRDTEQRITEKTVKIPVNG